MNRLPEPKLPVWMNRGEPLTLAHASHTWWQQVHDWLTFPLAQIDVDTCDEALLSLLAYQRDISRFPGETLSLFRLRVKHAFVNARDAGSVAGFEQIFRRLNIGELQQLERQIQYDWDVILLRINDEQLSRDNRLMMELVRHYGRTCRRYFFDVLNSTPVTLFSGQFDNEARCWSARAVLRPTSVTANPAELWISPGESRFVSVEVLPEDAEDRTYTARVSDGAEASVVVVNGGLMVTGRAIGECEVTITTNDMALTARVAVRVMALAKFVTRIESVYLPLFYTVDEDFTIDYGDGIDSRDYRIEQDEVTGTKAVFSTRNLSSDTVLTLSIRGNETVRLAHARTSVRQTNAVLEIVRVAGNRTEMDSFAAYQDQLRTVHAGAFDYLPLTERFDLAFSRCESLSAIPARLFSRCTALTTVNGLFAHTYALLTIPADIFRGCRNILSFQSAFTRSGISVLSRDLFIDQSLCKNFAGCFSWCENLTAIPEGLFRNNDLVETFDSLFAYSKALTFVPAFLFANKRYCTSFHDTFGYCENLVTTGEGIFQNCSAVTTYSRCFRNCKKLTFIRPGLFDDSPGVTNVSYAFYSCTLISTIPDGLFDAATMLENAEQVFSYSGITAVPDNLFKDHSRLRTINNGFASCKSLLTVGNSILEGCERLLTATRLFTECPALETVGDHIFSGCISLTTAQYIFNNCRALVSVGENIFQRCGRITSLLQTFYQCQSLKALPLLDDIQSLVSIDYMCTGCFSLESLVEGIFDGRALLTTANSSFSDCTGLLSLPARMFRNCIALTSLSSTFKGCRGLLFLPADMLAGCIKITATNSAFYYCSNLMSVPGDLLNDCIALTSTSTMFSRCVALTRIPDGLLNNQVRLTSVMSMFADCTANTYIPPGFFDNCIVLVSARSAFNSNALTMIPPGLFKGRDLLTDASFAFGGCALIHIPSDTFEGCIALTTLAGVFRGNNIEIVPGELLRDSIQLTAVSQMFEENTLLNSVGSGFFARQLDLATASNVFMKTPLLTTDINEIFSAASYPLLKHTQKLFAQDSRITGRALALLAKLPEATLPSHRSEMFRDCVNLSDYDQIPAEYK